MFPAGGIILQLVDWESIQVDNEGSWAFECAMYIHLNPAVPRRSPACGRRRFRIKGLGLGKEDRAREKAGMLPEEPKPDLILKDKGGVSNERKWRRMLPFSDVMEAVSDVKNEPCDVIVARRGGWGRDLALYVGQARCGLSLKELGKYTNMKPQAVCNAVNRFKNKMNKDDHLKECYRLVLKKIDDA